MGVPAKVPAKGRPGRVSEESLAFISPFITEIINISFDTYRELSL